MGGKVMIIPHEKMPTKTGGRSVSLLKITNNDKKQQK
jgi:hypothetical protein